MAQHTFLAAALLMAATTAAPARAVPIWATWTIDSATVATGSLPDGRSAVFTGFPFSANPLGSYATVSPAVPGLPSGANAPSLTIFPTDAGVSPIGGDAYFSLDLGNWGIDAETTFSIEDIRDLSSYRLELLDATLAPLSLASVQLSQHNLFFTAGVVQDYDISLDPATGALTGVLVHDSGDPAAGRHGGMAIFSNLPASTRFVRLFQGGTGTQVRDGLRITLSASALLPEPSALSLMAAAFAGIAYARGRGVSKR